MGFLKKLLSSQKNNCSGVSFFTELLTDQKRDSGTCVSYEICEFFKNTFFKEHLRTATASGYEDIKFFQVVFYTHSSQSLFAVHVCLLKHEAKAC